MKNENEFLKELNQPDDSMFESEDGNLFDADINTDSGEEVVKEEEEKSVPFHKDPKVQRYIQKELEKKMGEYKPQTTEVQNFLKDTEGEDEIATVLERIIGNDTPEKIAAAKDLKKVLLGLEEKGAQKALAEISRQKEAQIQAENKATRELKQGLEDIEDTYSVDLTSETPTARKTQNDFMEFVKKISPKGQDGNIIAFPDLSATFELFQETRKKVDNTRAKQLASRSMSRSGEANQVVVKDSSWKAVDKFLASLKS